MRIFLKYICNSLELLCVLIHPFVKLEIFLTGNHCNLAILSSRLDNRYNLGVWKKVKKEEL